jgi:hypothetical protein
MLNKLKDVFESFQKHEVDLEDIRLLELPEDKKEK